MFQIFRRPYFLETSVAKRWRSCLFFSLFVFLFLLVFQPFGLNNLGNDLLKTCLGYGLTTFLITSALNVAFPLILQNYFSEEKWTVGREFLWILLNIAIIGLGNTLYNNFILHFHFSLGTLLLLEAYTLSVGIFPVAITILIREARSKKEYERRSEEINTGLKEQKIAPVNDTSLAGKIIIIRSENANENLSLLPDDLFYIQSAENYVEIFYQHQGVFSRKLLRSTLKAVSESLASHPALFRCHKSYLVNLRKVDRVSGNAQGYKLHLSGSEKPIPVSRHLNTEVKSRLNPCP